MTNRRSVCLYERGSFSNRHLLVHLADLQTGIQSDRLIDSQGDILEHRAAKACAFNYDLVFAWREQWHGVIAALIGLHTAGSIRFLVTYADSCIGYYSPAVVLNSADDGSRRSNPEQRDGPRTNTKENDEKTFRKPHTVPPPTRQIRRI